MAIFNLLQYSCALHIFSSIYLSIIWIRFVILIFLLYVMISNRE